MSEKQGRPETPDESIPQDPGIPGPGTKDERDWPRKRKPGTWQRTRPQAAIQRREMQA
jgi:hypothetical protein